VRVLLMELKLELEQLADKIERSDQSIEHIAREKRSMSTPGCYAWNRPRNSNGADCDDRQRISFPQRS
jgi:hypothetical protein